MRWIHSIPNESKRSIANASRMKAQGLTAGILDVFIPYGTHGYNGFYIEMKAGKNKLTDNQKEYKEYLDNNGYKTAVCYHWEDAKREIEEYLEL